MRPCPTRDTLQEFLEELLPEHERQQVMDHVESCGMCQGVLHVFLFGAGNGAADQRLELGPREGRADRDILDALAKNAPPCPEPCSTGDRPASIRFPAPATSQGALGRLGAYHIQEEIGIGTYGAVYRAYEEKLERVVALKVLRGEVAGRPGARQRFEQEARTAAKLNNPHVVVIHRVFDESPGFPLPYIAMEFVQGVSLHALVRGRPQGLDVETAVRITQQVARGLAAAHGLGIVHRDVKPENILLRKDKEGWHAKITDFGIAQVIERAGAGSPHRSIIGTPHYMSPEAFRTPEKVDSRSDIYSLGVTLYQLLTGRLPFAGAAADRLESDVTEQRFTRPRQLNRRVPPDLEAIVLKCMAREPAERYETAAELAEQLGRWLQNEPVSAWRYRSPELLLLWYRRNRWLAAFLAAAACLLVSLVLWHQSDSALRRRAQAAQARFLDDQWNTAVSQQRVGQFGEAATTLEKTLISLDGAPELVARRRAVIDQVALLRRLDDFTRNSDRAWFYAGEERGAATRVACENALECYRVLDRPRWFAQAPAADLPGDTAALVRGEAHRLLILLAAMRIQDAILSYVRLQFQAVEQDVRQAQTALERAKELETLGPGGPSRSSTILEKGALRLLTLPGRRGPQPRSGAAAAEAGDTPVAEDVSAEDGFFLGVMHVYFAKHQNDPLAAVARRLGPREFDYQHPRETAVEMLRRAVQLDPQQYWPNFMLGRILSFPGPDGRSDFHEALQAFNTCISLRPGYSRGYEQRALILVQLSLEAKVPKRRARLERDAGDDLARAMNLAPDDPSTHWVRGQAFALMADTPSALGAFTRALELEDKLEEKVSRRNQLQVPRRLVKQVLESNPADAAAQRLSGLIDRTSRP